MSLKRIASKLQRALCAKGIIIKINHFQSYSEKKKTIMTKYVVIHTIKDEETKKNKNFILIETYKLADVVTLLSDMYRGD